MEEIIRRIEEMDAGELDRLGTAIDRRRRELSGGGNVTEVIEYRPHEDGMLQAERRAYVRKDGSRTWRGPYWTFRYHQDGRQHNLYLGKTDDPEGVLARKRPG
jgi:hypothetical protein